MDEKLARDLTEILSTPYYFQPVSASTKAKQCSFHTSVSTLQLRKPCLARLLLSFTVSCLRFSYERSLQSFVYHSLE